MEQPDEPTVDYSLRRFTRKRLLIAGAAVIVLLLAGAGTFSILSNQHNKKIKPPTTSQSSGGSSSLSVGPVNPPPAQPAIPKQYAPVKAAVDRATTPAELERALAPFGSDYGISVITTHYAADSYMSNGGVTWLDISNGDMANARSYADWFIAEWAKYPTAWINLTGIKHVVFVTKLLPPNSSVEIGGTNDATEDGTLFLNLSNVNFGYDYSALTIHHEFWHLIDYNFWGNDGQDTQWTQLNPPNFAYVSDQAGTNPATRDTREHPQAGFVTGHAMYDIAEDRAETYAYLFTTDYYKELAGWLPQDPYLAKKIAYFKNVIASRVPSMNNAYFDSINK